LNNLAAQFAGIASHYYQHMQTFEAEVMLQLFSAFIKLLLFCPCTKQS